MSELKKIAQRMRDRAAMSRLSLEVDPLARINHCVSAIGAMLDTIEKETKG